jgi:hypothetical protein
MPAGNDIFFSPDGMQYYTTLGTIIRQWNLTTPRDLSTIPGTASDALNITDKTGGDATYGITFRPSGTDFYVLSHPARQIYQYSI